MIFGREGAGIGGLLSQIRLARAASVDRSRELSVPFLPTLKYLSLPESFLNAVT